MAGNDEAESVTRAKCARCPLRARIAGEPSEVAVRNDLAVPHAAQRTHDGELEGRPAVQLELHVIEGHPIPGEVTLDPVNQLIRFRGAVVTRTRVSTRYRRPRGRRDGLPTLGGGPARTRACTSRARTGSGRRPRKLVPDEGVAVEPHLPSAPALGFVGDRRHRHGSQAYNRPRCPPRPAFSVRRRLRTSR